MVERLIEMIKEYQANVLEAASLFETYKGISRSKLMRARSEGLPRKGYVDPNKTIEYYFHGIGLWVSFPDREIDWDFGHGGRLDGFDLWRLKMFAEDGTNKFTEFKDSKLLEEAFMEAVRTNIIEKRFTDHQDDLYYLSSKHQ